MIDRKEVELLVRAQLKGGRDLQTITKSIVDLEKAIDSQTDAAKRGEAAYDGLKAAATALKSVQDELASRSNAARRFSDLTKQVNNQAEAVSNARKKLQEYEAALGADRTDAQQKKVQKLSAAYATARDRLAQYQRSQETLGAALKEASVNLDDLAAEQERIKEQQLASATATNRVNRELAEYVTNVTRAREAAKQLADQQAKLAKLEAGNAADARLIAQQQAQRVRRVEQAEADRLATLERLGKTQQTAQAKTQADSELAAIRDSEQFLRQYTEAKRKAAEQDAGLRKTADEAEDAARAFTTLARGSKDLNPRIVTLRDVLKQITHPAEEARRTLDGVEKEVKDVSAAIVAAKGPVIDFAGQFKKLEDAQKAIAGQATLIDNFRKQTAALRDTRTELSQARAQVSLYAAEVRKGGEAGAAFTKPLADAQLKLKAAASAIREQVAATREARAALQQAGIGAASLASAEQRLLATTRQSVEAMKALTDAAEKNGHAVRRGGQGLGFFRDEGRTTLSITQRLKGEILALTTAYFGVQGAIGLAADSLKAFTQNQGLQSSLGFALGGDSKAVGDEIRYVREQADRLGIAFEQGSKGYAKFAAAARKSGAPVEETRFIFEAFSETARVINLTPDELNGLFNAIGQSFSKGKIQAEELRQQIGERLPGAFAIAQEALKSKFPDLNKALEEGKVGVENMLLIAESVRKAAQGSLSTAVKSLDAEQQRFNNSVLYFKQQIAEAGFAEAYTTMLKELTTLLKGDDGKEFARSLAEVGIAFVNGIRFVVEYREEFKTLILVLTSLLSAGLIARIGSSVAALGPALKLAVTGMGALTASIGTLAGAFRMLSVVVGTFFVAFSIGEYLSKQSQDVRVFGILLVRNILEMLARIKFAYKELFEESLSTLIQNHFKNTINKMTALGRAVLEVWVKIFRSLGNETMAKAIEKTLDFLTLKPETTRTAKELAAELAKIRDITNDMLKTEMTPIEIKTEVKPATTTTPRPPVRGSTVPDDPNAAEKRAKEIDRIRQALEELSAKSFKKQEDDLDSLLKAVDLQYADLARDIAKLGGDAGRDFSAQFQQGISALKAEILRDFNDKLLKEQETLLGKLEQLDAQSGRKDKQNLEARLEAIKTANAQVYRDIATLRDRLLQAGQSPVFADEAKARADNAILELQNLERQKVIKEQLEEHEKRINNLIDARNIAIKREQEKTAAGEQTPGQGDAAILDIITQFQPQFMALTELAKEFALANAAAFDPVRLQEFLLKLQQAQNSSGKLNAEFNRTKQIIDQGIGKGIDGVFNTLYESIGKVTQGVGDWGDVFDNVGKAILQTLADIIKELALAYLKEQALLYIKMISRAVGASVAHEGAVVGHTAPSRTRNVSPALFALAPRYHAGGMPGLAPDEYPAILQKNEEVLSKSDPRNALNGGLSPAPTSTPMSQRFILVDDRAKIAEAMASAEGEQVTVLNIRRNIATIRQMING